MASMSSRKSLKFNNDDQYNSTFSMWEDIAKFIPKDKIIFEGFMLNNTSSNSIKYLQELGFKVVGNSNIDFFKDSDIPEYDILVSNAPYSIKKKVFKRLAELNKPFILIFPVGTMTKQFVKVLDRNSLQIIIPNKRMQFQKGSEPKSRCWFDTIYLCYKMNLSKDITFL